VTKTLTLIALAATAGHAAAVVVPFTETFETTAGWANTDFAEPTLVASGGLDGSSYISTQRSFANSTAGSFEVLFRGEPSLIPGITPDASGGAFIGNWIDAGVDNISFDIRHNGVAPVNFFVRVANVARFPGAVAVAFQPTLAGQWTTISLDLSLDSPNFVSFEGADYNAVFSNAGIIQIGIDAGALGGVPGEFTFELDNVTITPAPGAALALVAAGGLVGRRRRG
jgi:MYXO-CTERM domain-containing protein